MSQFPKGVRQDMRGFQGRPNSSSNNGPSRSFNTQSRLSPWEGGIAPGAGNNVMNMGNPNIGGNRSQGGLLPTPPALMQPSMQDVQLAVASNLLNLVLPNMQQNQQQNQMPPLLGLNANRGGLLPLNPPFQNQNFRASASHTAQGPQGPHGAQPPQGLQGPHGSQVSFGPKGNRGPQGLRAPGLQGQKELQGPNNVGSNRSRPVARRPEPYNKMGNRNQRPVQKNDDLKSASNSTQWSPKSVSQQTRTKQEKGDGRNEDSPGNKKKDMKVTKENKDFELEKARAAFNDVPSKMFNCHICSKDMWDSLSFVNHIKGKAHQTLIERREESYKMQIEMMRHEMKVEEQQRQLTFERKQRKGQQQGPREYCQMCNLQFNGSLSGHRKSNKHQQLKSFLHPKCDLCLKEFSTRIDWDHHLLTAGHLKAAARQCPKQGSEGNLNKYMKQMVDENSSLGSKNSEGGNSSECFKVKTETATINIVKNETNEETTCKANEVKKSEVNSNSTLPSSIKGSGESVLHPPKIVKEDVKEDDTSLSKPSEMGPESLPRYDSQKEIGMEMLQEKTGYLCRCCNRFLSCSADAKTHCRSQFHYDKYVSYVSLNTKVIPPTKSPKRIGDELAPQAKREKSAQDQSQTHPKVGGNEAHSKEGGNEAHPKEDSTQDLPKEDSTQDLPKEDSTQDLPKEDSSTQDLPKEDSTQDLPKEEEEFEKKEEVEPEEEDEDEEENEGNWKRRKVAKDEEPVVQVDNGNINSEEQSDVLEDKHDQTNIPTLKDAANPLDIGGETQDALEDLEKTLLIEETSTPKPQRGRRSTRGTPLRSRGRKRK